MVDKIKKNKSVRRAHSLQAASAVSSARLQAVKGKENNLRANRQATRELNAEEREQLKQMMREEAQKMFGKDHALPEKQREIIERAVEMAIDAGAVEENS